MMNKSKRILICVFCSVVTLILIAAMIPLLVLGYNKNEDKLEVNYSNTTTTTVSRTKVFYTSFSLLNSSNETFESADRTSPDAASFLFSEPGDLPDLPFFHS